MPSSVRDPDAADRIVRTRTRVLVVLLASGVVASLALGVAVPAAVPAAVVLGLVVVGLLVGVLDGRVGLLVAERAVAVVVVLVGSATVGVAAARWSAAGVPDGGAALALAVAASATTVVAVLSHTLRPVRALQLVGVGMVAWAGTLVLTAGELLAADAGARRLLLVVLLVVVLQTLVLCAMGATSDALGLTASELEGALVRRRQLQAMAAHDLRSPLATIQAALETVLAHGSRMSAERHDELLGIARRAAERVVVLSEDLTADVVGVDRREWRPTAVRDLLRASVQTSRLPRAIIAVQGQDLVTMPASPVLRVLVNLLDNAHKYGAQPVAVTAVVHAGHVELHVADAGPGFPEDVAATATTAFSRGGSHSEVEGLGLGLHIVDRTMRAIGGTIVIDPATSHIVLRVPTDPDVPVTQATDPTVVSVRQQDAELVTD